MARLSSTDFCGTQPFKNKIPLSKIEKNIGSRYAMDCTVRSIRKETPSHGVMGASTDPPCVFYGGAAPAQFSVFSRGGTPPGLDACIWRRSHASAIGRVSWSSSMLNFRRKLLLSVVLENSNKATV